MSTHRLSVFSVASNLFGPTALESDVSIDDELTPPPTPPRRKSLDKTKSRRESLVLQKAAGEASLEPIRPVLSIPISITKITETEEIESQKVSPEDEVGPLAPGHSIAPSIHEDIGDDTGSEIKNIETGETGPTAIDSSTATDSVINTESTRSNTSTSTRSVHYTGFGNGYEGDLKRRRFLGIKLPRSRNHDDDLLEKKPSRGIFSRVLSWTSRCSRPEYVPSPPTGNEEEDAFEREYAAMRNQPETKAQRKARRYIEKKWKRELKELRKDLKKQVKLENKYKRAQKLLRLLDEGKEKFWDWVDARDRKKQRKIQKRHSALVQERRRTMTAEGFERAQV